MKVSYSKDFIKAVGNLTAGQKRQLKSRIELFLSNTRASQLRNHKLAGQWAGYHSINVSGDIRAVYQKTTDEIYFVALGTHAQVYK